MTRNSIRGRRFRLQADSPYASMRQLNFTLRICSCDVLSEVIQDGLPPLTLLLQWMLGFGIESNTDRYTISAIDELDGPGSISKSILNTLVGDDLCVRSSEVKTKAAIFGFHARGKRATHAQINK